jgi:ribosome-associated translation inhibitor RaiA
MRDEDYFKSISDFIGKIMKEIRKLKRKGIWVNW